MLGFPPRHFCFDSYLIFHHEKGCINLLRWVNACVEDQQAAGTSTISEDARDHLQVAWREIERAVQDFSSEEPEDIHKERFQATPYGLFSEMFRAMLASRLRGRETLSSAPPSTAEPRRVYPVDGN